MQIKNKIFCFFIFFIFTFNALAEEFNITASEILFDKKNKVLIGKGYVKAVDSEGKIINADKITYEKSKEFLLAEGNVEIIDIDGNKIKTDNINL